MSFTQRKRASRTFKTTLTVGRKSQVIGSRFLRQLGYHSKIIDVDVTGEHIAHSADYQERDDVARAWSADGCEYKIRHCEAAENETRAFFLGHRQHHEAEQQHGHIDRERSDEGVKDDERHYADTQDAPEGCAENIDCALWEIAFFQHQSRANQEKNGGRDDENRERHQDATVFFEAFLIVGERDEQNGYRDYSNFFKAGSFEKSTDFFRNGAAVVIKK